MDARQDRLSNPLGMDENCTNCRLCEPRERVVHGYGEVDADFLFVGESPTAGAQRTGVPFTGDDAGRVIQSILGDLGLTDSPADATDPEIENAYLTYLARCRHPDRPPREDEVRACDPFLNAEVRMINPEVLVPVGDRALSALAAEHTAKPPGAFDAENHHATPIRGRGFEIVPLIDPGRMGRDRRRSFVEAMSDLMGRDYRKTKGRRGRREQSEAGDGGE